MTSHYKKSTATVAFFFGLYILNGIAITPCQARTTESIQLSNGGSASLQQKEKSTKSSIIDILPRLYTTEEVYARFQEHEFRATNDFKKCRLMVTGKIKKISAATFSKNPLVTLHTSDSSEGLKFFFENTEYNNNTVAALNMGDTVIIAGWNARPGTFGGIFLDDSHIMTKMVSKKKRQMLVLNGGIYDREICHK
ncbi:MULTISPECIES: OB-fold putative lipoprotein [Enterobacter cloacae complex]|uniref:OB-fold putative lipoprotein n=1 Tax=Enterobacter cloacae complex TaxID=354276 RepID=UPI001F15498D|nr:MULTISPECIES: OB-fold putative lipoprotein [Enterobacter cloacae complex]HCL6633651.1 hypothetical protein [Citrobacter freundii]MDH1546851.1 OB-fold putative lipoprotein [Enterobacter ludwigii]HCL6757849.1 hypothetical protein [Citrobacter freundii]HED2423538.1 hypothetical protein [Citrobacter freundii]HED3097854.1 hypothetical protein [Citrobacter freundii]